MGNVSPTKQTKPKHKLCLEQYKDLLKTRFVNQKFATEAVVNYVDYHNSPFATQAKPLVLLFVGLGTGKTELAKTIAEAQGTVLTRFDMRLFTTKKEATKLCGSGAPEGGSLTCLLKQHPNRVVIFDEIEKAHPAVFDFFVRLFDQESASDNVMKFPEAIFVLTSNLGVRLIEENQKKIMEAENWKAALSVTEGILHPVLKKTFSSELIARVNAIIPFVPFEENEMVEMFKKELNSLPKLAGVQIEFQELVIPFLMKLVEPGSGVRDIRVAVEREVLIPALQLVRRTGKFKVTVSVAEKGDALLIEPVPNVVSASGNILSKL